LKKPILIITIGGGFVAIVVFLAVSFLPIISTYEKYNIVVDPIIIKYEMRIETHVTIKNTGTNSLTNIVIHYGGTVKPDIIPRLNPGEKISLSPPADSELKDVRVTTDQGLNITKEYRTSASAIFVGNSGYGG
jgi:hypothetical protein